MGRTNPTYRAFLDGARAFADAAGYANHFHRDVLVLVSMLLAQQERLREQADEIARLRRALEADGGDEVSMGDSGRGDGAE